MRQWVWMTFVLAVSLTGATRVDAGEKATEPKPAKRAALLLSRRPGFEMARRLNAAGFDLNALSYPGLNGEALTWERVKHYNVLVLMGLGTSKADFTLSETNTRTIATLKKFLEAGGGILYIPVWGQMKVQIPPQDAFLKPLGVQPLWEELISDPETATVATAWKIRFAYTTNIAASPVTTGVNALWYPVPRRIGAQNHAHALVTDKTWTVAVRGGQSSSTQVVPLDWSYETKGAAGRFARDVPLAAFRQVGAGRIVVIGISPEYLLLAHASTTLEGIVLDHGLKQKPSGGYKLVEYALEWLSEPSLSGTALGGAAMDAALLRDPWQTQFGTPYAWPNQPTFPAVDPAYPGMIGARTTYSTGKASAAEWVEKAKAAGLSFVVFLEDFKHLSKENFDKLRAQCAQLCSPEFAAVPGFTIDDEVGNHYMYFGTSVPYPAAKYLTADGKTFTGVDPGIGRGDPHVKGQLAMTALLYAYSDGGFKLTAGNYLFSQDAAPFANFFSDYTAVGAITARNGKVIEDATADYLKIVDCGQGPLPVVVDLMDDPAQIGRSGWRTVLRLPRGGGNLISGKVTEKDKIAQYWNMWHFYPDNPTRIYITSGPEIESWCYTGPRDYSGNLRGDFVWQDYRWLVHGKVTSAVGLKEVVVLDGGAPFRRFLPNGQKEFAFTLDLSHDKQHNLVLIATDTQGGRAVSGEQWDRNHRLEEFNCSDRNNQLSYGYQTKPDGKGLLLGGNQTLATPNKRIDIHEVSPSGTFKNDPLLGAPAFDGAAGGEPVVFAPMLVRTAKGEIAAPNVSESMRLLHTGDVNMGESVAADRFADGIGVYNVWHTLWRTTPVEEYALRKRNHFFQVDPASPLAVFLWEMEVTLKRDVACTSIMAGFIRSSQDRLWALRGSDGTVYSGTWEETRLSKPRTLSLPFGKGGYAALLDSPLGGAAVFSLTDGMDVSLGLPTRRNVMFTLRGVACPHKKGESARVRLLLVGIPRATAVTREMPSPSTEVVERFYRDFGLGDGKPAYGLDVQAGKVLGQRYILEVDGGQANGFSGQLTGKLISSLPITVSGMNDRWSAVLYDRALKKARPVGVFEGRAYATVCLSSKQDLFIGHPLVADRPEVAIQVTQTGPKAWAVEIHNPTDQPVKTTIRKNPWFDPWKEKKFDSEALELAPGTSVTRSL